MKTTRIVKGMTLVHTASSGTRVYVAKTVNKSNLVNGFKIIVIDKHFNYSDIRKFARNENLISRTMYLANISGLDANDAAEVAKYITHNSEKISTITIEHKMNMRKVFEILYDEIKT